ncbi:MAG: hypothetical protein ABT19_08710 [Rhodanobacter sp. SCN 68-63]|nr:MAG: hypothetical protein ABT19_08710 [Rhodanobacter sp. SCN 68-63]
MRREQPAEAAPVRHISPEEAVAHIQALLDAKHERDRQGPSWPGADQAAHPAGGAPPMHPDAPASTTAPAALAHQRGDQSTRGKG